MSNRGDTKWKERTMHRTSALKELAHRAGNGVDVSPLWSPADGRLRLVVDDARAEERFALEARPENALDVFYHPYAFASSRACALAA